MTPESFHTALLATLPLLSHGWKEKHRLFLAEEHLRTFSSHMAFYCVNGVPETLPLPHFAEEVTPPVSESFRFFDACRTVGWDNDALPHTLAQVMENIPFGHLLLLMGQRLTPASLQDEQAIPPLRETLLQSCFESYNTQTSVAVRAWEKHVGRSSDAFFGEVAGNPQEKERTIKTIIHSMLEAQTWWNVFFHYKHGPVYEIREPGGHGIRWSRDGKTLIGFLEPFL